MHATQTQVHKQMQGCENKTFMVSDGFSIITPFVVVQMKTLNEKVVIFISNS